MIKCSVNCRRNIIYQSPLTLKDHIFVQIALDALDLLVAKIASWLPTGWLAGWLAGALVLLDLV